jgi:hypothetical protein
MMDPYHGYRRSRRPQRRDADAGLAVVRLVVAGLAVVLAPVTVTAMIGYALAWWRGWAPPRG